MVILLTSSCFLGVFLVSSVEGFYQLPSPVVDHPTSATNLQAIRATAWTRSFEHIHQPHRRGGRRRGLPTPEQSFPSSSVDQSLKLLKPSAIFSVDILGDRFLSSMEEDNDDQFVEVKYTELDRKYMRRALELAAKALGKTRPNPVVGCVVLDQVGQVVGEGWHPKAGEPHAEVFALREAGEKARGGSAYVTLEPCNHHGRTPPCVDALLNAGIKKVVAGMIDPFPLVGGKGLARLRENGVEIIVCCEEDKCKEMNRPFVHRVLHARPLGYLPLAYRQHAFVRPGREVLLLGEGEKVVGMIDAVVIDGSEEGLAALEELEAHDDLQGSVYRVVLASDLSTLSPEHPLWTRGGLGSYVLTNVGQGSTLKAQALRAKGMEVVEMETSVTEDPLAVSKYLHSLGLLSALWLIDPSYSVAAVKAGVIQDIWVHASLEEADEIDGVGREEGEGEGGSSFMAKHFGKEMKVSVMSCDALSTKACVLSLRVEEDDEKGK